ncbi:MAG: alpha/beta fold hydrolase [Candidatus Brocadiae bacterium]|nr:alpha/beta fold hydrolase [Candidatus Brocadiia bacterium]
MKRRSFALGVLVAFSFVVSTASAKRVADPGQRGPYEVGFTCFLLVDGSRDTDSGFGGRPIPVYMWYPVDCADIHGETPEAAYPLDAYYGFLPPAGSSSVELYGLDRAYHEPRPSSDAPFPLVVFSPGWGHTSLSHVSIGTRLASHGIAVAIVTHYGDGALPWDPFHHVAVASVNRPLDLSFALDRVLDRNGSQGDLLYGVVNPRQVAAAGWSLGGYAALALAGGDDMVCDAFLDPAFVEQYGPPPPQTCVPALPDPRFKAVVSLDGSSHLLRLDELARITAPTMLIGQEPETASDGQARAHAAIRAHPCYRVDVINSIHWSFSDMYEAYQVLRDMGIYPPEFVEEVLAPFSDAIPSLTAHQLVNKYMIAFLKTQLEGDRGYQRILTRGWAITREPDIEFFVTEKHKKEKHKNKDKKKEKEEPGCHRRGLAGHVHLLHRSAGK